MSSSKDFDLTGLSGVPGLADVRYFPSIGSTNDEALAWAAAGAPDFSLVLADEQTSGRGRMGRKWHTPPHSALAFSLILRPQKREQDSVGLFSGLGALALVDALHSIEIDARIKWPNDVLIQRKKVAGILVETVWLGSEVESVILGMGVNVSPEALPAGDALNFPAICVDETAARPVSREHLLSLLLTALSLRRTQLGSPGFLHEWESALEFRGETVEVWAGNDRPVPGRVMGLAPDGSLKFETVSGRQEIVHFGEVHLRPV